MNKTLAVFLAAMLMAAASSSHLQAQEEMIVNGKFDNGLESWTPMNLQGAAATFDIKESEPGKHAVCVTVPAVAEKRYFVQLDQTLSSPVSAAKTYTLTFRAKSKPDTEIVITMGAKSAGELWRQDKIALSGTWQNFSFPVKVSADAATPFLNISGLAATAGEYWFADVSLKEAKDSAKFEATKPAAAP